MNNPPCDRCKQTSTTNWCGVSYLGIPQRVNLCAHCCENLITTLTAAGRLHYEDLLNYAKGRGDKIGKNP